MLERTIRETAPGTTMTSTIAEQPAEAANGFLVQIQAKIDALHSQSRQGLWHITAFLLISIGALFCREINILDYFSEGTRVVLGAPPAPFLIHIVLAVSTISALIIISGRLANEAEPGRKWEQVGHRGAFYLFYFFSNALNTYFIVIFFAGLAVLLLEHYQIWNYCRSEIRKEKEVIRKVSMWPLIASGFNK